VNCSRSLALVTMAGLFACSQATDETGRRTSPAPEPVVVYLDAPGALRLQSLFDAFTEKTTIPVTVREAPAEENLRDVINNTGAPPADVLLTNNVHDIWLAGDEGALRRLTDTSNPDALADAFRDPEGQWFTIGADPLVIVYSGDEPGEITYADLARPEYSGQLCLSGAHLPENRLLIAHLIADHDQGPAERIVRRWIGNLALPPQKSAAAALAEVEAGNCRYAIAKKSDVAATAEPLAYQLPAGDGAVIVSAYGLGLARHARYPLSATTLLDWLAGPVGQAGFAQATGTTAIDDELPADWSMRSLAELSWHDSEARRLAERARWH
jgi:iron(III) transport system substrate-binding protein